MSLNRRRRYRFGPFCLEPDEQALLRDGRRVALTPKAFDVLRVLVEHHARLLDKDELMQRVWPDAFVEESNLTHNISILRKALGERGESDEAFIETVPKRGYRFVARVHEEEGPSAVFARPKSPLRPLWIGAAGAAVLAGMAWWMTRFRGEPPSHVATQWRISPLTSYLGSERYASFSPDGSQVAFSWNGERQTNFDVYIQPAGGGTAVPFTRDPAHDLSPAWSPDGRSIAFVRLSNPTPLGILGEAGVFVAAVPGGPERKLGETRVPPALELSYGSHLCWSADGEWLVIPDRPVPNEPPGLFLLSVRTGEKRRLTRTEAGQTDFGAAISPNGRQLAFVRFLSFTVTELFLMSLSKELTPVGVPRRASVGTGLTSSPAWTPDGREVLFLFGHLWGDSSLWSTAASGAREPRRLTSLGGTAGLLALAPPKSDGMRAAYTRIDFDPNIWQIELDRKTGGVHPGAAPRRLIASTRVDSDPAFSPDGGVIAFQSSRSGSSEIWVSNRDGTHARQVTSFGGPLTSAPSWSPDGQQLAFSSRPEGHADLYTVSANGGVPRRLTKGPTNESEPSWSSDGRWIYYRSNRTGAGEIWKLPVAGGEPIQVTKKGAMTAQPSRDGKYVYYSKPFPGGMSLWRVPSGGGEETQVLESLVQAEAFDIAERGIYFIPKPESAGTSLRFFDFASRKSRTIAAIVKPVFLGVSVSPDGSAVLYTQVDQEGADLMQITDARWQP